MIDHLRFNYDYPSQLIASMACPIFRKAIDLYIDLDVSVGYAEAVVSHWQYNANALIDKLLHYSYLFSQDFCAYAGEDVDSMIEESDYPRITEDLFIDLRELLLRWNVAEPLARAMIKQLKDRLATLGKRKTLSLIKAMFIEEIIATLPKEDQPYHLVRPPIRQPADMLDYIKPQMINIYKIEESKLQVYLSLNCAWEEEFGMAWLVRNGQILYVGSDEDLDVLQPDAYYQRLAGNYAFGNMRMKNLTVTYHR